jgi:hypothetical protein
MAMACFGFVTFLPLRPDFSLPCFISRISRSTFFPADGEYLRPEDFFEADFLAADFFAADFFAADFLADAPRVLFFALLPSRELLLREVREREILLFELLLDFFLVAFFVAITILLAGQMARGGLQVACLRHARLASRAMKRGEQTPQGFVS